VKLALLGATGGVGREVLSQAVAAGHLVTAVVRNPTKLPAHVGVVRQDLANANNEVLADALRDAEAVISAVALTGQPRPGSLRQPRPPSHTPWTVQASAASW
jgi:putative NADH-flavin reductase